LGFAQNSPKSRLVVKPGDAVYWQPDPGGETESVFGEIILKTNDNITGYALMLFGPVKSDNPTGAYSGGVIKSALFPQIGGKYQKVSEEYVYAVFGKIKSQWRKMEEFEGK
jgi:hypothetical protein